MYTDVATGSERSALAQRLDKVFLRMIVHVKRGWGGGECISVGVLNGKT